MSNTDQTPETTKRKVAEKTFIDATGAKADIEKATGLSYKSLADGKEGVYQIPGAVAGSVATMLALFGASTLATNSASANRQAGEDGTESDTDAVMARFEAIVDGDWGTERGGGVGRGIDVDAVVEAINEVMPGQDLAALKTRLEGDADLRKTFRNHSQVKPVYDRILAARRPAKAEKPLGDLLGAVAAPTA